MELFNRLPKWAQIMVVLVFCGLLTFLAYKFYIKDMKATMEAKNKQINELSTKITQGREAEQQKAQLEKNLSAIKDELEILKTIIPFDPETGKLLRVFQNFARDENLMINKISPGLISQKELYSEQPYTIVVDGRYENLAIFFDKISRTRRIINIRGLDMKPYKGKDMVNTINATFSTVVYMQLSQEEEASQEQIKAETKEKAAKAKAKTAIQKAKGSKEKAEGGGE